MKNFLAGVNFISFVAMFCLGLNSCASKECEVVYDKNNEPNLCLVLLNPPGETGKSQLLGTMERSSSISREPGGPLINMMICTVNYSRKFDKSGNVYSITGTIYVNTKNDKAKISKYDLTVTGGVYGNSPHHFIKEK
jgi:hypothetical protein